MRLIKKYEVDRQHCIKPRKCVNVFCLAGPSVKSKVPPMLGGTLDT